MKTTKQLALAALSLLATLAASAHEEPAKPVVDPPADPTNRVQIALLLDTSNSMDGLIDQAKTQLWKVVNTFIEARRDGKAPFVEVALYEYGNNSNAVGNDWIRLVSPLSRDLDELSKKLFDLKTNGGEEYCGAVIQRALGDLAWDPRPGTYKAIFIAGNEPFTQGRVDARQACKDAHVKGIVVNSIHCGSREEGIAGSWHDGPALAGGEFLVINQDRAVAHIPAPQDKRIAELSLELNKTYLGYGARREQAAANQQLADSDAQANATAGAHVQRALTKASGNYSNASWDLVDAMKEGKVDPATLAPADLPEALRGVPPASRAAHITKAAKQREAIQAEIQKLNSAREDHIAAEREKLADAPDQTLDQAMIEATRKQAASLGYSFPK